jgi:hypothetical protein
VYVGVLVLSLLAVPMPTARGTLLGTNLFPADNPWNQNISQAPVATNSAAIINSIIATNGNGRFHPKDNMGWSGWEEFRNLTPNDKTNLQERE